MATELSMTGNKKLGTLSREFSQKFNYLSLVFKKGNGHAIDPELTLATVREKNGGELSIVGNLTVGTLEKRFMENYGLNVQVVFKNSAGKIFNTSGKGDEVTLTVENAAAKEQGYVSFV